MSAQTEAYVRKKPKRIIQNQALIMALMCLAVVGGPPLGAFIFWLAFGVYPSVIVPFLVVSWAVSAVTYTILWLDVQRQNKKSS